ncbi:MAG: hypothetical protein QW197_03310 [Candidatus Aenigmatarchaeota archaeon]
MRVKNLIKKLYKPREQNLIKSEDEKYRKFVNELEKIIFEDEKWLEEKYFSLASLWSLYFYALEVSSVLYKGFYELISRKQQSDENEIVDHYKKVIEESMPYITQLLKLNNLSTPEIEVYKDKKMSKKHVAAYNIEEKRIEIFNPIKSIISPLHEYGHHLRNIFGSLGTYNPDNYYQRIVEEGFAEVFAYVIIEKLLYDKRDDIFSLLYGAELYSYFFVNFSKYLDLIGKSHIRKKVENKIPNFKKIKKPISILYKFAKEPYVVGSVIMLYLVDKIGKDVLEDILRDRYYEVLNKLRKRNL